MEGDSNMSKKYHNVGFDDVDKADDSKSYVKYLDGITSLDYVKEWKRKSYEHLQLSTGDQVLEVGCGVGDDARAIAEIVGSSGKVIGIDNSSEMVSEAQKRSEGSNLSVEFRLGDVQNLDFDDNMFNGCRTNRVLLHLDEPKKALSEMIRVTKSAARIVVVEPDSETLLIDASDREVTRKILNYRCDSRKNGWMGRQLYGLFKKFEMLDIAAEAGTLVLTEYEPANNVFVLEKTVKEAQKTGVVSLKESNDWLKELKEADKAGRFFSSMSGFIVSGRKP